MEGKSQIKFRMSCMRSKNATTECIMMHNNNNNNKREELLSSLADMFIPHETTLLLKDGGEKKKFVVDLCNFDFELMALIYEGSLTVGISLNGYQYLGARSFCSGKIPPDITPPYIPGEWSQTLIRLRPSIASLLCDISQVQVGDIILDPCAGVGTIPVEASMRGCYGLGGDLVTLDESIQSILLDYHKRANDLRWIRGIVGVASALAWDAALLPIRGNSVDCIISDLPFGVRCMSSKKLHSFLPLLFAECARCLRTKTGKMTLLCGSYQVVLESLDRIHSEDHRLFERPTSIIPINIGGLTAWIILLKRTCNAAVPLKKHRQRVANMTRGRRQTSNGTKRPQA